MEKKEWLGERARALEEEYFWRKERELIARLREQGRRERERQVLENRLGVADDALLSDLQTAGFTPDNLGLLHLVPLVEVAWAEGEVTTREREFILALAERRGILSGTPAYAQLVGWLDRCPDAHFFDRAFQAMRALLAGQDADTRAAAERDLVEHCTRVAEAAGGILRMAAISRDERECLKRIADRLTEKQRTLARRRLAPDDAEA